MLPGDALALSHTAHFVDHSARKFMQRVQQRAQDHGVKVVFSKEARVPYMDDPGMLVSGYFIDRPRQELAVAMDKPQEQWLGVLVHESCHMDQWIEQAPCWTEVFMPDGREAVDWLNDWTAGSMELSSEDLADVVRRCREVELDCERRAVACIKEFGLPLPIESYIRKANAYVFFYDFIATSRQWYPADCAPYEVEDVHSHAPSHFTRDEQELSPLRQAYHRVYSRPRAPSPGL